MKNRTNELLSLLAFLPSEDSEKKRNGNVKENINIYSFQREKRKRELKKEKK